MSEIKNTVCETTTAKYLVDENNYFGTVNIKAFKENDPDVIRCWFFTTFSNRFIIDERQTLIGELIIKFRRITNDFLNRKNGLNTEIYSENLDADKNNLDFYINKDGDLIITGEENEVNKYLIDTNGDLIWQS